MNLLHTYLTQTGTKRSELAALVGTSRGYISDLASGKRDRPGLTVAAAIERATAGAVPASSWVAPREPTGAGFDQQPAQKAEAAAS